MARTVTQQLRAASQALETSEAFLCLVEIDHEELAEPIRVTSDAVNTVSNGVSYVRYPFALTLPTDPEDGIARGKLTVDNIDREIVRAIREIQTPPTVKILIVLSSDPNTPEVVIDGFSLTNINYDEERIEGNLEIETLENEPYPGDSILPSTFPALF